MLHCAMVSTLQALLDALHHGYILMGVNIDLIIFDEVHHAVGHDPYNRMMREFYRKLPARDLSLTGAREGYRGG
ncbi:hypothetical protein GYMLUDRAFT_979872 [Collybiopsis luxurians FD-317 M1]|uniref:Helicase ATP-binding domain-containing protein n=1 Tax=Collybiopsis luxurians FD-317 M1 TaxID=944289 RepID=A0A0D0CAH5_9AGAR|nr:hypothetical protein GYMLUDRAFT_979872 [Collybiopsis luxurians FD-317 M1]